MKRYSGSEDGSVTVDDGTTISPLPARLDLAYHSPDGFSWGYGGSGPAQLSLALLADAAGSDEEAVRHYQEFKERVVSRIPAGSPWSMTDSDVLDFVRDVQVESLSRRRRLSWGAGDVELLP